MRYSSKRVSYRFHGLTWLSSCSFSVVGSSIWNDLSLELRSLLVAHLVKFHTFLKSFFFSHGWAWERFWVGSWRGAMKVLRMNKKLKLGNKIAEYWNMWNEKIGVVFTLLCFGPVLDGCFGQIFWEIRILSRLPWTDQIERWSSRRRWAIHLRLRLTFQSVVSTLATVTTTTSGSATTMAVAFKKLPQTSRYSEL